MDSRLTDSVVHGHLWGTDEVRAIFAEPARLQGWLDVLTALAGAQAELGLIPAQAATAIAAEARVEKLDLNFVAAETRRTSHSTLGLIAGLQRILAEPAREWVYFGATVQDVTDTWTALAVRRVCGIAWRDLRRLEAGLLALAAEHRDTVLAGRTHGQAGAPTSFGLKAASWADEVRRHLDRLREGGPRWFVGQLAGAAGTLAFYGAAGTELRNRFCARLGLADPGVSWTSSRDRVAEFGGLLAMVTGTLARIGTEVYQLARSEIDELREPVRPGGVGSITMPHKRNPEASEHLDTLARLVRASAGVLVEGMVTEHERDGRAWKAEWVALPEACLLTGAALRFAVELVAGLEVNSAAMRANLGPYSGSEQALAMLAPALGKHRAQELLQRALSTGRDQGLSLAEALRQADLLDDELAGRLTTPYLGAAGEMVDAVLGRAGQARAREPEVWP
ncbi:MAG TPA: adenylosuccinate lyase family protein [Actinomycetes bacterium]|nr:adenylosuccinate lyase family protein [Actinomycetes bacterium]